MNLKEIDGWDKDAIKGYVKGVSKRTADAKTGSELNAREMLCMQKPKEIDQISIQKCMLVVNSIQKRKVELVLKQLGAETDGNPFYAF